MRGRAPVPSLRVLRAGILTLVSAALIYCVVAFTVSAQRATPVIVIETSQGTFAFETFREGRSVSVAHIVETGEGRLL